MQRLATLGAKGMSRARRKALGLLLRLPGGASSPESMLSRFPDGALFPLRRQGLDPVPQLAAVREHEPVSRLKMPLGLRGWLVTGYDEARAVFAADPQTFSNDFTHMVGNIGITADQDPGGLGFTDPPAHTRLRHLLTPHFTVRALTAQAGRVQRIIDDALDDVAAQGAGGAVVDLQEHFALQIPSRVIMELLGVPDDDRDEFHRLSTERFQFGNTSAALDLIQESIELLRRVVVHQRAHGGPGLIGEILREHGDTVGDVELAGLADGVLTGGLETTVSMLSLGAVVLLQDPALADRLRTDDTVAVPLVEELLRHLSVVQAGFPRYARKDVELGGKSIFAGDVVMCSISGANRDPRMSAPGATPLDRVDVDRSVPGHLAFGHGLHRCVGAELARLELRAAYPALVRRFPRLRPAEDPADLPYRKLSIVYGLERLPVTVE